MSVNLCDTMITMNNATITELETMELRRLAVECECDPRSVAREIRGERVRGVVGERIRRLLRDRGLPCSSESKEAA